MSSLDQLRDLPVAYFSRGPRNAEDLLFGHLDQLLTDLGTDLLRSPIHVVVPSHSLRLHLLGRLMEHRQRSLVGLKCWTLHRLAEAVVERAGAAVHQADELTALLIRRFAARKRILSDELGHLNDGYGALVAPVTDLFEAGLEPEHFEALDETLAEEGPAVATRRAVARARALLEVAVETRHELDRLDQAHRSELLKRATELLADPDLDLFPINALIVFGFSDATGVATDFLQGFLSRVGGSIYLDRPPDPAEPEDTDPGEAFARRFSERVTTFAKVGDQMSEPAPNPQIEMFQALGTSAEVREVGGRIRMLLDRGQKAESIGVVSRQPDLYLNALRTQFWRLGIPFSGVGVSGPLDRTGRCLRALRQLLTRRQRVSIDCWLDTQQDWQDPVWISDLRLALFGLGCGRLSDVARLDLESLGETESLPLPARLGYDRSDDANGDEEITRLHRRRFAVESIRQTREHAELLFELLASWNKLRNLDQHLDRLDAILKALHWSKRATATREMQKAIDASIGSLPRTFEIEIDELVIVLGKALDKRGAAALGGLGGGVQALDVIEARGRTFEHLFVLGMNKGIFPRTVRQDAALPDSLRLVLGREGFGVLPDLPRKLAGFAEERYLFAQLVASSPRVTLSWQEADDNGKPLAPSPLVERVRWSRVAEGSQWQQSHLARSVLSSDPSSAAPRTAFEHALRSALIGPRCDLGAAFKIAQETATAESLDWNASTEVATGTHSAAAITNARLRVLDEMNLPPGPHSQLGPYFGFVGSAADDPRSQQKLYVTTLESMARCPWRTFVERLLRIEPHPDPLEILPGLEPLLIGQVVHRSLERVVSDDFEEPAAELGAARQRKPRQIVWPKPRDLNRIVARESRRVCVANGIIWEGFAEVLAKVVLPYLETARQLEEDDESRFGVLGAELEGSVQFDGSGGSQRLFFKADRVTATHAALQLIDYKTSRKGISSGARAGTRHRHLMAELKSGRLLQAAAYATAAGGVDDLGQYVYLSPDFDGGPAARIYSIRADDGDARQGFVEAATTLLTAWKLGVFTPRLLEPDEDKEPMTCSWCAVSEACLRGDSGARGRLRDWTGSRRTDLDRDNAELESDETALLRTWYLGVEP